MAVRSPQQETIIDLAVRSKLILDSIDAWLLQQPSLIRKKYRVLAPIVLQRNSWRIRCLYMGQLGLERRARGPDLARAKRAGRGRHGAQAPDLR